MTNKPYAESCDQNRDVIFEIIAPLFSDKKNILEIGSGTGQHAVFFAEKMPQLNWQTSDREENIAGIKMWLDEASLPNTAAPITLDVSQENWPEMTVDGIFSANTLHIMHKEEVAAFFAGVGKILPTEGLLSVYGPFNYQGKYTSKSNARFDGWLKSRDPQSGIKDFEWLQQLAGDQQLTLLEDFTMPANNRILCWKKSV